MPNITDLGREQAEASENQGGSADDYEPYDVSGDEWVRHHPTTAITGNAEALRLFTPRENPPYMGLVLSDPEIVTDDPETENSVIIQRGEGGGDTYKVVNTDDEATRLMEDDGTDVAIFDGNDFEGEVVDDFDLDDDQNLVVKYGGSSMRQVIKRLDANGGEEAGVVRDDDGNIVLSDNGNPMQNKGLIEYHPDNGEDHFEYRFARDPVLREDLEGERVGVMLQRKKDVREDYDGRAYFTTVFRETEDGDHEAVQQVSNPDEVTLDLLFDSGWLEWSYPDDDEVDSGNSTTTAGLSESDQEAVDKIQTVIEKTGTPVAERDRESVVEVVMDNSNMLDPDTDPDEVVDALFDRAE